MNADSCLVSGYTIDLLDPRHGQSVEAFFRIYSQSINPREQKPKHQILALITRPEYQVLLLKQQIQDVRSARIVGFSMLFCPPRESFCLLEYLAVDPGFRSHGLGGALLSRTFKNLEAAGIPYGLMEVDSALEVSEDQEIRKRRQRFYRRHGCLALGGLEYQLPLPGDGPPPRMEILVYSWEHHSSIKKSELAQWLKVLYNQVYGVPEQDPRITEMLNEVSDPVKLV